MKKILSFTFPSAGFSDAVGGERICFMPRNGKNTFTVPKTEIFGFSGIKQADVTFGYEVTRSGKYLIVPDTNYLGSGRMKVQFYNGGAALKSDKLSDGSSKLRTAFAEKVLSDLETSARENGLVVLRRKKLGVHCTDINVVYKNGKLIDFWKKGEEYPLEGCTVIPLTSTLGGLKTIAVGDAFWNVSGSTSDVPKRNWIKVWRDETGHTDEKRCLADGHRITKKGNLVGAHVVENQGDVSPDEGVDDVVFIVPLCKAHNHHTNTAQMNAAYATDGLWLKSYGIGDDEEEEEEEEEIVEVEEEEEVIEEEDDDDDDDDDYRE